MTLRNLLFLFGLLIVNNANLLIPGISKQGVILRNSSYQLLGFPQAALNGTEVQISISCESTVDLEFEVQFVLRSSPCDKEFFDARNAQRLKSLLQNYFDRDDYLPEEYDYNKIMFYRSSVQKFSCKTNPDLNEFVEHLPISPMTARNVSHQKIVHKRQAYPGVNAGTIDGGTKLSLKTYHPAQTVPVDGIYFLIVKITGTKFPENTPAQTLTVTVEWRGIHGFLSAIDYPLLRFYTLMCVFYGIVALVWLVLCIMYYKDILRIQYWIGAVIIIGMLEKAFFVSEYASMNSVGTSDGLIQVAELISCAKRTMARVLVIIVCLGYGVVKPRLGNLVSQVAGVGLVYFVFCTIESLSRVSKNLMEDQKQKQLFALPLVLSDMVIFYWIYSSLGSTMATLRMRRNVVKLGVYRHFANTLLFAVIASLFFMMWSILYHVFPTCLMEWKGLWIDTAFWHILFCGILIAIMFLWRPSNNNQRYAFTPLLDDSEDENDQDEIFNSDIYENVGMKYREQSDSRKGTEKDLETRRLEEDLRWIESNIPASLTDQLIIDDDEERELRELEQSKML